MKATELFDLNEPPGVEEAATDVWLDCDEDGSDQRQNRYKRHCIELSNVQRANVADRLQQLSQEGQLPRGSIKQLASSYYVSRWSVSRL